jgi:hypothetical protein
MTRSFHGLGFALSTALVLVGCSFTTDGKSQGDGPNGSESDGGGSSSNQPNNTPGSDSGAPSGSLSFRPANVPADASLTASGEWIFNTETCGDTKVTIDTVKGTVSCRGQAKDAFTFKTINQTDTSQGTLTAGLFVTRRLLIEPGMLVNVVGNRPLVIVALDTATIQGTLRASALREHASAGGFDGARRDTRGSGPAGGQAKVAHAGGAGGGHCGIGGGSIGGKAYGSATNTPLVGGSSGGGGGTGESGAGGGALQVVAGVSLEVSSTGAIEASGGGGFWHGNGGGAGGAILLEAPAVSIFGTLAANGGGGGAGYDSSSGADGSASAEPAKGGPGGSTVGGNGGDGAAAATIDGQPGAQPNPTFLQGGGGGGAGRIRLNSNSGSATLGAMAVISPAPTTPCATQGNPTSR